MATVERVVITPELAGKWLDRYKADVQRPMRQLWVKTLAEAMAAGEFDTNDPIQIRLLDGEAHLIDGRHRLNAIVRSGLPQTLFVVTDVVKKKEDLYNAFRRVNQGLRVTNLDYCIAMGLDTETGLSRWQLARCIAATPFIVRGFSRQGIGEEVTIDTRIKVLREYSESAGYFFESTVGGDWMMWNPLSWGAVVAVGLVTFQESAIQYGFDKVADFWNGIARMKFGEDDPRGSVSKMFLRYSPPGSKNAKRVESRPSEWIARYVASCFNAWVDDRYIESARPDIGRPIVIKGSQYKG